MSNSWNEHDENAGDGTHHPVDEDEGVLAPTLEDVPYEEVQSGARESSRGVNPRLLAILLAVAVLGGSGFMFMRMKNQSAARAAAMTEQLAPVAASASTEPTLGVPLPQGSLPSQGAPGGLLAGGATPQSAVPGIPLSGPPVHAETAPMQAALAPVAPSPPPTATVDPQVEVLQRQIGAMSADLGTAMETINQLRTDLAKAQASPPVSKKTTAPAFAPAVQAQAKSAARAARPHRNEAKKVAARRVKSDDKGEVITERRDSRLAGMSVRAIYPMTGRDARAWINVDGDVVEVSAGSTVAGAYVKRVNPEAMEVVTDAGVIRAKP